MEFSVNYGILQGVFAVPNCVVDRHIKLAGAAQLKVLLFLLRHSDKTVDCEDMAKKLGYSQADIKDAVNYWKEVGVLSQTEETGQPEYPPIMKKTADMLVSKQEISPPEDKETVIPERTAVYEQGNIKRVSNSYRFTQKEAFLRVEENEGIRFLIDQCRVHLGRELQGSDVVALVSIHDWAGLSPDVILLAVGYCASRGLTDMRSIERQCTKWLDLGIRTHEQAEEYIKRKATLHSREALVQGAFGISGRRLSSKEQAAITRWFEEFGYDISIIRAAFDKTVDNTGKLSFAYLDKILANWFSKGVKTLEQAMAEGAEKPKRTARETSLDLNSIENEGLYETPKL